MKNTGLVVALCLVGGSATNGPPTSSKASQAETVQTAAIAYARSEWEREFQSMPPEATLADVERLIGDRARDRGAILSGGTRDRFVYYLIDDVHQIAVYCDGDDRVVFVQIEPRGLWVKMPNGTLRCAPTPSGVPFDPRGRR